MNSEEKSPPTLQSKRSKRYWVAPLLIVMCIALGAFGAGLTACPGLRSDIVNLLPTQAEPLPVITETEQTYDPETATWGEWTAHHWQNTRDSTVDWTKQTSENVGEWSRDTAGRAEDWLKENNPLAGEQTTITRKLEEAQAYCSL